MIIVIVIVILIIIIVIVIIRILTNSNNNSNRHSDVSTTGAPAVAPRCSGGTTCLTQVCVCIYIYIYIYIYVCGPFGYPCRWEIRGNVISYYVVFYYSMGHHVISYYSRLTYVYVYIYVYVCPPLLRGNRLSNSTCLTQVFFNSGESCSKIN